MHSPRRTVISCATSAAADEHKLSSARDLPGSSASATSAAASASVTAHEADNAAGSARTSGRPRRRQHCATRRRRHVQTKRYPRMHTPTPLQWPPRPLQRATATATVERRKARPQRQPAAARDRGATPQHVSMQQDDCGFAVALYNGHARTHARTYTQKKGIRRYRHCERNSAHTRLSGCSSDRLGQRGLREGNPIEDAEREATTARRRVRTTRAVGRSHHDLLLKN